MPENVSPGEPILPHMTADWFNSTLKKSTNNRIMRTADNITPAGFFYGRAASVGSGNAYDPVWISGILECGLFPTQIALSLSWNTQSRWCIVQQDYDGEGTYLVCAFGLTWANVTQEKSWYTRVRYDTGTGTLKTSARGQAELFHYNSSGPSLIYLNQDVTIMYKYVLQEDFDLGIANATIWDLQDDTTTGETQQVEDVDGIFSDLVIGDSGLCIYQQGGFYAVQAPCSTGGAGPTPISSSS